MLQHAGVPLSLAGCWQHYTILQAFPGGWPDIKHIDAWILQALL